jgi:hypothetical protein
MVKKFFEGIKDDIKDTIAPPQRALVVVDESEGIVAPPVAEIVPEGDGEAPSSVPLRALPVEPLDADPAPAPPALDEPAEAPPLRALPVDEDEIIDAFSEEP